MALLAAAAFAAASALEHGSAGEVPDARLLAPRQLAAFMRATLRHPKWLVGMLVSFAGFVLHAVALHNGALAVVQPLLVCALLFALPINRWLRRERITAA